MGWVTVLERAYHLGM